MSATDRINDAQMSALINALNDVSAAVTALRPALMLMTESVAGFSRAPDGQTPPPVFSLSPADRADETGWTIEDVRAELAGRHGHKFCDGTCVTHGPDVNCPDPDRRRADLGTPPPLDLYLSPLGKIRDELQRGGRTYRGNTAP